MENPHPKMITDESSGVEVENQRHTDWEAGAEAERGRFVDWLQEEMPYQESHQHTLVPRFLSLTRPSLELYKRTGELNLFPK